MGKGAYFTEVTGYPDELVKSGILVTANNDVPLGKYWKVTDSEHNIRAVVVSPFSDYAPEGSYEIILGLEFNKAFHHLIRLVRLTKFELFGVWVK